MMTNNNHLQPILIIDYYGNKEWYLDGKLHREDGPAVETIGGISEWHLHGKLHRTNGPAYEYETFKYYYLEGIEYSYDEWFNKLTPEQQENYLWNFDE